MGIFRRNAPIASHTLVAPSAKTVHCTVFFRNQSLLPPCSIPTKIKKEAIPEGITSFLERVMGIEPTRPAWKAGILAIELHPHLRQDLYYHKGFIKSSIFKKILI